MPDYFKGSMEQVVLRSQRRYPSVEDLFNMRRKSAGVAPLFALAEYVKIPGYSSLYTHAN
jgi:Terpene synthase family 2, C-terminal metal binding